MDTTRVAAPVTSDLPADNSVDSAVAPLAASPGTPPAAKRPSEVEPPHAWQQAYRRRVGFTDIVVIAVTVTGAQVLRFDATGADVSTSMYVQYAVLSLILAIAWIAALVMAGAWHRKIIGAGTLAYGKVLKASFTVFGLLAAVSYLGKLEIARGYVAIAMPLGLVLLLLGRVFWRSRLQNARREGRMVSPTIVVGSLQRATELAAQLTREPLAGYKVLGICIPDGGSESNNGEYDGPAESAEFPILGSFGEVVQVAKETNAATIAVAQTDALTPKQIRRLSWSLEETDLDLVVAPMLSDITGPRIHSEPVPGLPLVHMQRPHLRGPQLWLKTAFDYTAAFFGLILVSPIFLVVAIAIKLDDRGPVFFRQERVGKDGEPFKIWKFRSMVVDAENLLDAERERAGQADAVFFKAFDDTRITRVGRFIRKTSIDELPQLFNVLAGDMSLVGPRPLVPGEGAEYQHYIDRRALVKPGLTGLWQVSGRSEISGEQRASLDLIYVEEWSFLSDIGILFRTVAPILGSKSTV